MPDEKHFLRSIRLRNVLSFGPDTEELTLGPLNVLIGPNGSGKSNLIDAIAVLHAVPHKLVDPIRNNGGITEWLWKGDGPSIQAEISVALNQPWRPVPLRHRIVLGAVGRRAELVDEAIENDRMGEPESADVHFYYRFREGHPVLTSSTPGVGKNGVTSRAIERDDLARDQSVIAQRREPDLYPELAYLEDRYRSIRIFDDWGSGRRSRLRQPQDTGQPAEFLSSDCANLGLVLSRLNLRPGLLKTFRDKLKAADATVAEIVPVTMDESIQVYVQFEGLQSPVPSNRLSDGTFRYLCLLTVLLHPDPPPVVCLEEPEVGLHPDLMPGLAKLLVEASARTQLIVTTHSDTLVDALTDTPEAVVVCEKVRGATRMRRLTEGELRGWLDEYGLGQLWREGHIGGNRW